MDRATIEAHLALAEKHLAQSERHVARQRELIAELHEDGHDTHAARELLKTFEEFHQLHVAERNRLQHELAQLGD